MRNTATGLHLSIELENKVRSAALHYAVCGPCGQSCCGTMTTLHNHVLCKVYIYLACTSSMRKGLDCAGNRGRQCYTRKELGWINSARALYMYTHEELNKPHLLHHPPSGGHMDGRTDRNHQVIAVTLRLRFAARVKNFTKKCIHTKLIHISNSCKTLIWVHEMHGRMHLS